MLKRRAKPVYERVAKASCRLAGVLALCIASAAAPLALLVACAPAAAQGSDSTVLDARDAFRKKDRDRLAGLRAQAFAERNPFALWVDYWELTNRIGEAQQAEISAFAERWKGSYVEDRLRNDWLRELGRRGDWANFAAEYPRFRMNDDRDVSCYALLVDRLAGKPFDKPVAMTAWLAQKDADEGCALLSATLFEAGELKPADVWTKIRGAVEAGRIGAARQAAALLGPDVEARVGRVVDSPARYFARNASAATRSEAELTALAIVRMASSDSDAAATLLGERWEKALPGDLAAWTWANVARQSAVKLQPEASDEFLRAERADRKNSRPVALSDDTLAWKVRAALRADGGKARWQQVIQGINAMTPEEQKDAAWVYWKARALQALAADSQDAEALRAQGRALLAGIADRLNFYGELAAEDLGRPQAPPAPSRTLSAEERAAAAGQPGLARGLALIGMGLRSEGVREWNFSIRGLGDRELLAAAQMACDRQVWDRCINTSDRTQGEIDMAQRFPMPLQSSVVASAAAADLDPAFVYGLIRQESRFVMDARSGAGASGLMQLMPATAKWTARKIGLPYSRDLIADRDTNLKLGNAYLKLVLDDMGGSQALAAAAYNAGPGRPRKWRDGPPLEPAVWIENIPFGETRDYVKKVLSNATYYARALGGSNTTIRSRLGAAIGPADPNVTPDKSLP